MKRFFPCIKVIIVTVFLIFNAVVVNAQINWLQIGTDIDGIAGDNLGNAVSINNDGSVVAIGAYHDDEINNRVGSVKVYNNQSGSLTQKGQTIYGLNAYDLIGKSVALNSDGSTMIIGAIELNASTPVGTGYVIVYQYDGLNWVQLGNKITGDNLGDQTGWAVSINSAGTRIAISENLYDNGASTNSGRVRIYDLNVNTWDLIATLTGKSNTNDQFGQSVSLNAAGDIIAVGASGNTGSAGYTQIYANLGGLWPQIGNDMNGASGDQLGWAVKLNSLGNRVAVSAPYATVPYVNVYENNANIWTLITGGKITGTGGDRTARYGLSLNNAGDIIAVGSEGFNSNQGRVRVFKHNGTAWNIIGVPVVGEASGDWFGVSAALNGDGTVLAAGGYNNAGGGIGAGNARVYSQTLNSIWTGNVSNDWNVAGNWDVNAVPVNGNNVYIPVGKVNYPTISAAAQCTYLVIESNATSTGSILGQTNLTVSGATAVKRNMTGNAWHFVAATAAGQPISAFLTSNTNIPLKNVSGTDRRGMMDYNEAGNIWNAFFLDVAQAGNLDAGKGYSIRTSADGEVIFAGALQGAAVNVPVTTAGPGWNCVGNPYPSAIFVNSAADATNNFITINDANFDPSYKAAYVWEQGNNAYTIVNNASPAFTAALGQAYMVKAKAGVTQFSFTTAMQTHAPTAALKSGMTSSPEVKLVASMTGAKASTLIKFDNDMTEGLDEGYDAGMFKTGFDLFTRLVKDNGVDFGLQCLPNSVLNKGEIVLGLQSTKSGEVSFSVETQNLPLNTRIVLEDRLKNTLTELTNGDVYTTQIDKADAAKGRFFLHTSSSVTALDEFGAKADFRIYQADARIYIAGNVEGKAEAALFDVMGRTVSNIKLENASLNSISSAALKNGVYLLKIKHQKGIFSQKVMVKNQ